MDANEQLQDSIERLRRMRDAGRVFSLASNRAFELLGAIGTMRSTVEKTMPFGQTILESENVELVHVMLRDPQTSKIFKDPAGMLRDEKYVEFAREVTRKSLTTATSLVSAAALVFAHAVFDATLFDFCRACSLAASDDWIELISDRKLSIHELQSATKEVLKWTAITKYLSQLEKESILKKADVLHRIIKPVGYQSTVRQYAYSRERLHEIDEARHDAVHKLRFREGFPAVEEAIDYLTRTVIYMMGLINFRYGLQVDTSIHD